MSRTDGDDGRHEAERPAGGATPASPRERYVLNPRFAANAWQQPYVRAVPR